MLSCLIVSAQSSIEYFSVYRVCHLEKCYIYIYVYSVCAHNVHVLYFF